MCMCAAFNEKPKIPFKKKYMKSLAMCAAIIFVYNMHMAYSLLVLCAVEGCSMCVYMVDTKYHFDSFIEDTNYTKYVLIECTM